MWKCLRVFVGILMKITMKNLHANTVKKFFALSIKLKRLKNLKAEITE